MFYFFQFSKIEWWTASILKPYDPQKLSQVKLTFFMLFIIMEQEKIEKILEINQPSFELVKNYLNEINLDNKFNILSNEFIFHNVDYPRGINHLIKIENSVLKVFANDDLIQKLNECVEFLNTQFKLKFMWLMVYPPNSKLNFHKDHGKNRHVLTFTKNERFFNYEVKPHTNDEMGLEQIFNNELKKTNNIDEFNDFFINTHSDCKITTLEPNCVYTFGNTLHTFYNGSNTNRINLVFEIFD